MNQRLFRVAIFFLVSVASLLGSPAIAWNDSGHEIVALIAWEQMDDATRQKAIELLRAHPRFDDHFKLVMPREVTRGTQAEKDQWIFAHAATWSDQVRSSSRSVTNEDVKKYSRPWWHFIDEPVYLNNSDREELKNDLGVNLRRDPPKNPDEDFMNVVQATKNSSRIVRDKNQTPAKRSVHLCWLNHLVGDAHQPLHSSALFTSHRFRGGDHGGNYVNIGHDEKLHAFWDGLISTDEPYPTVRILAADLLQNSEHVAAGKKAAKSVDPGVWIDESHELAKTYAYSPEIRAKIGSREGHSHLGDLDPSPQYELDAESVSERRAVEAGYRLAELLRQLLN